MTKGRKGWFIGWALVIIIIGVFGGMTFAIFSLVLLGFIELIRLLIVSVKQSKVKLNEQSKHLKELREQRAIMAESDATPQMSSQNEPILGRPKNSVSNETAWKKLLITLIAILPTRLITDPLFLATSNMDTATRLSKAFGFKLYKCRYCHHYFSSINWACKDSPNKKTSRIINKNSGVRHYGT